ncbi:MAG: rane dipeptidase [Marmoricola sp.]|nr:rane dipeptidase [Marmoricola sp.]
MTTDRIKALLSEHGVMDGHNDLLWAAREKVGYDFDRLDLADTDACRAIGTHTDLPRLRAGGVAAQFWSVYVPATMAGDEAVTATLEQVDAAYTMVGRYADQLAIATTVDDVERAWQQGRIASLMGAEGGHQINESLGTLRMLHRIGVRYLTLTHNDNVPWADSATDEPVLGGLSDFGREVVAEMNRIGMLVDLSHVSADVMRQALDVSTVPVVFSHSSARALCDHPRNVPDDVLARLADNGGVCMVTFVPRFVNQEVRDWDEQARQIGIEQGVDPHDDEAEDAFLERHAREHPSPKATIDDVVAHLEHVREVAGVEHIGLGGDYDGVGELPKGLEDVTAYPRLLEALAQRGWSDEDLARLTCRNVLRAMGDAGLTSAGKSAQA